MNEIPEGASSCPHCGGNSSHVVKRHHLYPKTTVSDRYMVGNAISEDPDVISYIGLDTQTGIKVTVREYFPQEAVSRDNTQSSNVVVNEGADLTAGMNAFLEKEKQANPQSVTFTENGTGYAVLASESSGQAEAAAAASDSSEQEQAADEREAQKQSKPSPAEKKGKKKPQKKANEAGKQGGGSGSRNASLIIIAVLVIAIIAMLIYILAGSKSSDKKEEAESFDLEAFYGSLISTSFRDDAQAEALSQDDDMSEMAAEAFPEGDYEEDIPEEARVTVSEFLDSRSWAALDQSYDYDYFCNLDLTYTYLDLDADNQNELLLVRCDSMSSIVLDVYELDGDCLRGEPASVSTFVSGTGGEMDSRLSSLNSGNTDGKMRLFYYNKTGTDDPVLFIEKKGTTNGKRLEFASYVYDGSSIYCRTVASSSRKGDDAYMKDIINSGENLELSSSDWDKAFNASNKKCISSGISEEKGPILVFILGSRGSVTVDGTGYSKRQ